MINIKKSFRNYITPVNCYKLEKLICLAWKKDLFLSECNHLLWHIMTFYLNPEVNKDNKMYKVLNVKSKDIWFSFWKTLGNKNLATRIKSFIFI